MNNTYNKDFVGDSIALPIDVKELLSMTKQHEYTVTPIEEIMLFNHKGLNSDTYEDIKKHVLNTPLDGRTEISIRVLIAIATCSVKVTYIKSHMVWFKRYIEFICRSQNFRDESPEYYVHLVRAMSFTANISTIYCFSSIFDMIEEYHDEPYKAYKLTKHKYGIHRNKFRKGESDILTVIETMLS